MKQQPVFQSFDRIITISDIEQRVQLVIRRQTAQQVVFYVHISKTDIIVAVTP